MLKRQDLVNYLDQLLLSEPINDYCPNGLQVEGRADINKIVTGVTACQALLDAAIEAGADAIIVHHGYFWRNEEASVVGIKRNRIQSLLKHDINLLVYHLPLDIHPIYGNNAQLATQLNLTIDRRIEVDGLALINIGQFPEPMAGEKLAQLIQSQLMREPLHVAGTDAPVQTVAWCTGAAQGFLAHAQDWQVDAYITGEASEASTHLARELGLHFYAAGHHATERYGVRALGEHLAQRYQIEHAFIDIENPV